MENTMDLTKLNEQVDDMSVSLINMSPETQNAFTELSRKLSTKKKRFNQNEAFVFSQSYKQMKLSNTDKKYLIETDLVKEITDGDTSEKVFKHRGIYYKVKDSSRVSPAVVENMSDYENNRNMTDYSVFKKIAKEIQNDGEFVFEEPVFSSSVYKTYNLEIEKFVNTKFGKDSFYFAYESGSSEGGDYLGNESVYEVSGINMSCTEFPQFLPLFKRVCPEISYVQAEEFKNSIADSVKETEYKRSEWYGNYTEYVVFSLSMKDAYEKLKSIGVDLNLNNSPEQENNNNRRRGLRR